MRELANEESSGSIAAQYELGKEEKETIWKPGIQKKRSSLLLVSWLPDSILPVFLRSSFISVRLVCRWYGQADEDHLRWTDGSGSGGAARGEGLRVGNRWMVSAGACV